MQLTYKPITKGGRFWEGKERELGQKTKKEGKKKKKKTTLLKKQQVYIGRHKSPAMLADLGFSVFHWWAALAEEEASV